VKEASVLLTTWRPRNVKQLFKEHVQVRKFPRFAEFCGCRLSWNDQTVRNTIVSICHARFSPLKWRKLAVTHGEQPVPTVIFHETLSAFSLFVPSEEKWEDWLCYVCVIFCALPCFLSLHINNGTELRDCIVEVVGLVKIPIQSAARGPRKSLVPLKVYNPEILRVFFFTLDSVLLTEGIILDPCFLRSGSNFANNYSLPILLMAQSV
jgi:hypothetical protein